MNQPQPEQVRKYLQYLVLVVVIVGVLQEVGGASMIGSVTAQKTSHPTEEHHPSADETYQTKRAQQSAKASNKPIATDE